MLGPWVGMATGARFETTSVPDRDESEVECEAAAGWLVPLPAPSPAMELGFDSG